MAWPPAAEIALMQLCNVAFFGDHAKVERADV